MDTAFHLEEAADILGRSAEEYQAVLLNWNAHDAFDAGEIAKLREVTGDTVLILLLADHGVDGLEEALQIKNTGIMNKPFFVSAFREKILEMRKDFAEREEPKAEESGSLEGLHFLAAEDNVINAEILKEFLAMEGASCEIVENGQLAVERFENAAEGEFDAILMDVQMPVMNGYDATRAIRASGRKNAAEIPIIAMTANAFAEDEKAALEAGMNVHLAKPINMEMLKKIVNKYVRRREPGIKE